MSEPTKAQPQITPFEFLQQFPEAPSVEQIEQWKQQAPGARLRIWHSSDGKRVYVLRAIGGQELAQLQASLPPNIPPEKEKQEPRPPPLYILIRIIRSPFVLLLHPLCLFIVFVHYWMHAPHNAGSPNLFGHTAGHASKFRLCDHLPTVCNARGSNRQGARTEYQKERRACTQL